jgi:hypothetical protein
VNYSQDFHDNTSEASDQPSDVRSKHNFRSPRYNRGYRRGNSCGNHNRNSFSNYTPHSDHRRYDRSNYYDHDKQRYRNYSSNRRGRYTDRSHADSLNRKCDEPISLTQNQPSDSDTVNVQPEEHECN